MEKVAAVIVTYNRLDMLKQCIEHLLNQTIKCDILVVNNASDDGTGSWLNEYSEHNRRLFVYHLNSNIGGAGGFHFGMETACESGYDLIWIMDDDCLPDVNALEELLKADRFLGGSEHYGFLAGRVLWTDGTVCKMNRQKKMGKPFQRPELSKNGIERICQSTFVSLLIPCANIIKYGLPLAPYFIWNDDIEFTRRLAIRNKLSCYLVEKSIAVHTTGNNKGSNIATDSIERIERYRMACRNEYKTYRMEGITGIFFYYLRRLRDFIQILFFSSNHRRQRFFALFEGMRQGVSFNPQIEYPIIEKDPA